MLRTRLETLIDKSTFEPVYSIKIMTDPKKGWAWLVNEGEFYYSYSKEEAEAKRASIKKENR